MKVGQLSGSLLAFIERQIPGQWLFHLPFFKHQYSIYDHLPANYVLASTPLGKQNEFGDF
ncbi:MAG TPA: hypothetical protein VEK07_05310 [Polyangiaceae bacterium]|nr:hypothetical protein [Polyangiaceae bacterium]